MHMKRLEEIRSDIRQEAFDQEDLLKFVDEVEQLLKQAETEETEK